MLAYLRLLIRERLSAWRMAGGLQGQTSQQKTKRLFKLLGIALLALMCLGMVVSIEYLLMQGFVGLGDVSSFLQLVFLFSMVATLLMSFFFVLSSLFFSKDIVYVAALPITSRQVFSARLVMVLLGEGAISLLICLPAAIMYGLHTQASWDMYLRMLLFVPWLCALPIAITTLLSFLLIRVSALWKRREGLTTIASFVFMGVFLFFYMRFVSQISEDAFEGFLANILARNASLFAPFLNAFPPIRWLNAAVCGVGLPAYGYGLLFVAVSAACLLLLVWLLGRNYQALAIKQTEAISALNKGQRRSGKEPGCLSPMMALCRRELKDIFITPIYATNSLVGAVMFPVMLLAFYFASSSGNLPQLKPLLGMLQLVPRPIVLGIATVGFCLTNTMNMAVSTSVSREGRRNYFSHVIPVSPETQLRAKLWMGLIINAILAVPMAAVLLVLLPGFWPEILAGLAIAFCFSVLTCALSISLDASRPNFHWRNETEAIKQSVNGMISMFGSMLLLALLVLGYFGLIKLGLSNAQAIGSIAVLLALLAAGADWFLRKRATITYSLQEKSN